jgi:hypothetical protein
MAPVATVTVLLVASVVPADTTKYTLAGALAMLANNRSLYDPAGQSIRNGPPTVDVEALFITGLGEVLTDTAVEVVV